jgi:electron transfer flavoprotein beta subunit
MAAKKKPLTQKNLAEIGLTAADAQNKSAVQSVEVRPARSAGIKIVDDGSAATQVVDYLIAHRVI